MKTRNGLFADVPENLWNDWHWQVANRAETVEDLKKYMTLTPDEEEGVRKTLGKLRMAVLTSYAKEGGMKRYLLRRLVVPP